MKNLIKAIVVLPVILLLIFPAIMPVQAISQSSTITVTTTEDSGPGSLRNALLSARSGMTILFDPAVFPLDDPQTIFLTEELPVVDQGEVVIDASSAGVILDGSLLDVTSRVNYDNLEFKINDEVIFSSTFDEDILYWNKEVPNTWMAELAWDPDGKDETGGSLAITVQPDGNGFVYFYEELPGVDWRQLYSLDGPQWYPVRQGDSLLFSYDYKGFDHVAFYSGMYESTEEVSDLKNNNFRKNTDWQHASLAMTVPADIFKVYPTLRIENYYNGTGLKITSDGNEIYGLVLRNFYKGIVINGDNNQVGQFRDGTITETCTGGCNRFEKTRTGLEVFGSQNVITGNWIGLSADKEIGGVSIGITLSGDGNQAENQIIGNWILAINEGMEFYGVTGTQIRDNHFGPDLLFPGDHFSAGIVIGENTTGTVVGPNNTIYNFEKPAIVCYSQTAIDTEIFENEILGSQDCGILIGLASQTHIHDNWIGIRPDGTAFSNLVGVCINTAEGTTIGPGNVFANNREMGLNVGDSPNTQITANSFYNNQGKAIDLWGPAGDEPDQPEITAVSTATLTVAGKASTGSIVEIYYDEMGEGAEYVLSCKANSAGKFYCTVPKDRFRTDINVTAVARYPEGGTSSFSKPFYVPPLDYASLTGITGPLSVSTDPQVIGMSVVIAGLLLFIFNTLAEFSTRVLDDLTEEGQAKRGWLRKLTLVDVEGRRWLFFLRWAVVLVLIAFAQSMLEQYRLFSSEQLQLALLLLVVTVVLSLVQTTAEWITRRRWKMACQFCSEINLEGLIFVVGSVALSRLLSFSPGIIIGLAGVVFLLPELTAGRKGLAAFWTQLAVFLISMLAWGLSVLFMGRAPLLETVLLTLFFLGSQSVFFSLIPIGSSSGRDIFDWKKVVWLVFSLASLAVFVYMIFMPAFTDVDAMRQNDYLAIYIIGGVLLMLSGVLWAGKKWGWFEKRKDRGVVQDAS